MKKFFALLLALTMVLGLVACGDGGSKDKGDVYNVCNIVNGNLGDKSFFDSCEAGLRKLESDGRIKVTTLQLGGTEADQPKWKSTLYEVAESEEYDLIVCGTYQMPDFLKEVATKYPEQKFLIYDDTTYVGANSNVVNMSFRQNDMGYLVGVFAGSITTDTSIKNINKEAVLGFVGGVDSPVINDFLYGYILGAQSVNPDIKIDTRYTNDYVDTAIAKEYGLSMINDNKCDIIWGVAGNAGNGGAEAALESGKGWFIGVDSDQEQTFSADLAASSALLLCSTLSLPVSTTHAKTTSIMGVGAVKNIKAINFGVVKEMVLTWVLTFPGCGLIGFIMTKIFLAIF